MKKIASMLLLMLIWVGQLIPVSASARGILSESRHKKMLNEAILVIANTEIGTNRSEHMGKLRNEGYHFVEGTGELLSEVGYHYDVVFLYFGSELEVALCSSMEYIEESDTYEISPNIDAIFLSVLVTGEDILSGWYEMSIGDRVFIRPEY